MQIQRSFWSPAIIIVIYNFSKTEKSFLKQEWSIYMCSHVNSHALIVLFMKPEIAPSN